MDKSSFYHSRANGRQSHSYIIFLLLTVYVSSYCSLFGIFSIKQSFAWTCLRRNAFRTFCSHAQLPSPPQKKNKRGSAAAPINTRRWRGGNCLFRNIQKQIIAECKSQGRLHPFAASRHLAAKLVAFRTTRKQRECSKIIR